MALVVAVPCPAAELHPAVQRFEQTHRAMGTVFTIDIYARDQATAEHWTGDAFDEVDRIEDLLSNYRPASELSRIDREAVVGPVVTDPETFAFLERSVYWSQASKGAFDITVGPLLRAWGFFFKQGHVPAADELAALRGRVGWQKIELNLVNRTVEFRDHVTLDLDPGSIGKGFAVDRVVSLLRSEGVASAFISAGGSTLYGIGAPPGEPGWPVDVPDPRKPGAAASKVLLKDMSLSTGACTEKFFIQNGHRYCHIFNPLTMRPVEGMLQTTVISPSATDSDALSTVVFVGSVELSERLLRDMPETRALIFSARKTQPDCVAVHWPENPCSTDVKENHE